MTRLVGFDLETTGVSSFTDVPVSYAFVDLAAPDGAIPLAWGGLVNPGRHIPIGASAIHGITDDMVASATPLVEVVETLASTLSEVWRSGGVVVGMNVSYDLTMVESLCRRHGVTPLLQREPVGPVLDVLVLDRHFDRWRKGSRKLVDLCRHYGVSLESAHSARDDAHASLLVLARMRERFADIDLLAPEHVTATLRSWYQEWLSSFSSYLVRTGHPPVDEHQYEWPIHFDDDAPTYPSQLVS